MDLKFRTRFALKTQRLIGWATFPAWGNLLIGIMRFGAKYKIHGLAEIRKQYKQIKNSTDSSILICSNHLTKIDSLLISWSFASVWFYMKSFRTFSWNLPERANFYHSTFLRIMCYLGSCVPINRGGDRDSVKKSMDKITHLLKRGHTVTIFPEGGRSRTGRVNTEGFAYGVGRLVKKVENIKVICVYLRGNKQDQFSEIPKRGSEFYINMEVLEPKSENRGLQATRDFATQIINKLTQMEQRYFATIGQ